MHYEIREEIGRGGMGVVYKAHDTKLDRTLALKFLPHTLHDDETAHKRFVAEAQTASGLDHPNICTIYEIGETEDGATFIAMAHYTGETLQEKIAAGPLDPELALDYAIQIARGLSKAHNAGITHRDMKPANCIVTEDGILKILDFGLARVEDQQLTRTGELLGTLSYMSPEQVGGTTADARSDVWSAGAMYYEMLTGANPFGGSNQAAVLYAVMHAEPQDLAEANDSVSPETARLVSRCLKKDQTRRFADASQLLEALERLREPAMRGVEAVPAAARAGVRLASTARTAKPKLPVGGRVAAGVGLAVVATLFLIPATRGAMLSLFQPEAAVASTRRLVAVIPSMGGSEDDQLMAEGLTSAVTWELTTLGRGSDSLDVLSAAEVLNLPIRTGPELRQIYHNVSQVLTVAVDRIGALKIIVQLAAADGTALRQVSLPHPGDAVEAFQDSLPKALASLMGFAAPTVGPQQPTRNADAYLYYTRGRGYLTSYDNIDNLDLAVSLFEDAIDEDSTYARAYAGLCETHFEKFRLTNDTMFVAAARPNCEQARRLGGDLVEVLVAVGGVYLQTGDPDRALEMLQDAQDRDPLNAEAHWWLGRIYQEMGEAESALDSYQSAIGLSTQNVIYYVYRGGLLLYLGRYEEANQHYEQALRLAPDNILAVVGLSGSYILAGRPTDADAILEPLRDDGSHPRIFSNLGYSYWLQGRFEHAVEITERGLAGYPTDLLMLRWQANSLAQLGRNTQADQDWRRIVEIGTPVLATNPHENDILDTLAEAHAHLGEVERATEYLGRLDREPNVRPYHVYHAGRTLELLGEREAALEGIREAVERGYHAAIVEQDPWLADLRDDPRY